MEKSIWIILKEVDGEEINLHYEDLEGAEGDYLFFTESEEEKDKYEYVVLQEVETNYKDEEEIRIIDETYF